MTRRSGERAARGRLKTLACLHDVCVHYAYCDRVNQAENDSIGHFAKHVLEKTRASLHDPVRVMPFANLEFPKATPRVARWPRRPRPEGRARCAPAQ